MPRLPNLRLPDLPKPLYWLLAIALLHSLIGFDWGTPVAISPETMSTWQVDTIAPVRPLTEAYYGFTRAGTDPVIYPLLHFVILNIAYLPYVAYEYLSGGLVDPGRTYPYGAVNPAQFFSNLTWIANAVSLFMALGIIITIYALSTRLFNRQTGLWAAALTCFIGSFAYYAKTSNLDVPYIFWMLLSAHQFVLIACLPKPAKRHYILFAAFAACAVATKDQAYGFFIFTPIMLLAILAHRDNSTPTYRTYLSALFSKPVIITLLSGVVIFALGNNLLFGGLNGFLRHIEFAKTFYASQISLENRAFSNSQWELFGNTLWMLVQLLGPLTLLLALGGIADCIRKKHWPALIPAMFILGYYLIIIASMGIVLPRYLLGAAVLLSPYAAHALQLIWQSYQRIIAISITTLALGTQIFLCLHLIAVQFLDARFAAEDWIKTHIPKNTTLEIYTQPRYLPRVSDHVDFNLTGNSLDVISYEILPDDFTTAAFAARNPEYVLVMRGVRLTGDPDEMTEAVAVDFFQQLLTGKLGYQQIAYFETPNWLPFAQITAGTLPKIYLLQRQSTVEE